MFPKKNCTFTKSERKKGSRADFWDLFFPFRQPLVARGELLDVLLHGRLGERVVLPHDEGFRELAYGDTDFRRLHRRKKRSRISARDRSFSVLPDFGKILKLL